MYLQASACEPASIDSLRADSTLCHGEQVDIAVSNFLVPLFGQYTVVAYGACGNDTATFSVTALGAGPVRAASSPCVTTDQ